MKLACFTMMRNESAILGPFLDQVSTFFDRAVILDHASTDSSAAIVRDRAGGQIELCHLQAAGYPQAEVASFFARRLFDQEAPDFLFFLDCDEFLPFADRGELEAFLSDKGSFDLLKMRWMNVSPANFEGENIFANGGFQRAANLSDIPKVIISASLQKSARDWSLLQGYHGIATTRLESLRVLEVEDRGLFHIPVQSRAQFMFKLAAGSQRMQNEKAKLRKGQGYHWVDLAREAEARQLADAELRAIALGYPKRLDQADLSPTALDFDFPYVRSPYGETAAYIGGQIQGLMRMTDKTAHSSSGAFAIANDVGEILATSTSNEKKEAESSPSVVPADFFAGNEPAEIYSNLIEPLFNLPAKLPITAWVGHIPFLFVLFRLLRPATYVELGVHNGASLIAACTAAKTYNLSTLVSGVDTWEGDEHAGFYQGETTYRELLSYLSATFPKRARLERCLFSEALSRFSASSVDILHIDGLHTYDAVKEDFSTWFNRVSPTGVILFHDISIYDRGFGVHRLWAELKERFTTLEFHHSAGLGVVLLDPEHPRLASLVALSRNPAAWRFYQNLVANIASSLPERMAAYEPAHDGRMNELLTEAKRRADDAERRADDAERRANDAERHADDAERRADDALRDIGLVHASTSWRITAPIRAARRMVGG